MEVVGVVVVVAVDDGDVVPVLVVVGVVDGHVLHMAGQTPFTYMPMLSVLMQCCDNNERPQTAGSFAPLQLCG